MLLGASDKDGRGKEYGRNPRPESFHLVLLYQNFA